MPSQIDAGPNDSRLRRFAVRRHRTGRT